MRNERNRKKTLEIGRDFGRILPSLHAFSKVPGRSWMGYQVWSTFYWKLLRFILVLSGLYVTYVYDISCILYLFEQKGLPGTSFFDPKLVWVRGLGNFGISGKGPPTSLKLIILGFGQPFYPGFDACSRAKIPAFRIVWRACTKLVAFGSRHFCGCIHFATAKPFAESSLKAKYQSLVLAMAHGMQYNFYTHSWSLMRVTNPPGLCWVLRFTWISLEKHLEIVWRFNFS